MHTISNATNLTKILSGLFILLIACGCQSEPDDSASDAHLADYTPPESYWGLINDQGEKITKPLFDDIRPFSNGLAAVNINGYWGYVSHTGEMSIPGQFLSAGSFHDHRAVVRSPNGQYGVIGRDGKYILEPKFDNIRLGDQPWIAYKKNVNWYLYNRDTENISEPYSSLIPPSNHPGVMAVGDEWQLINPNGAPIGVTAKNIILPDQPGPIPFQMESGWGYLNASGEVLISPEYESVQSFVDSLSVVRSGVDYLLIDATGQTLLKSTAYLQYLGHGWYAQRMDSLWRVSSLSRDTLSILVDEIHRFSDRRAVVRQGEKWNYLLTDGSMLLNGFAYLCWDFDHSQARVIGPGGMGVIDTSGQLVLPATFMDLRDLDRPDRWAYKTY